MKTTVVFYIWGQRSETVFDETSELDPLTWIQTCYAKGFILPDEVYLENNVLLYSKEQLMEILLEG